MGRNLLRRNKERTSLTKGAHESEPSPDGRPDAALVRLIDFAQDADGHWLAILSCGHTQHLRHQPPWQNRAWVLDVKQRTSRLGQPFACGWCAAAVEPDAANPSSLPDLTLAYCGKAGVDLSLRYFPLNSVTIRGTASRRNKAQKLLQTEGSDRGLSLATDGHDTDKER
jgi:hypothetical protein